MFKDIKLLWLKQIKIYIETKICKAVMETYGAEVHKESTYNNGYNKDKMVDLV